jgi:peptide methionine sulfoxide reductase MsrB
MNCPKCKSEMDILYDGENKKFFLCLICGKKIYVKKNNFVDDNGWCNFLFSAILLKNMFYDTAKSIKRVGKQFEEINKIINEIIAKNN